MTADELRSTLTTMENAVGLLQLRQRGVTLEPQVTTTELARHLFNRSAALLNHYAEVTE